MKQDNFPAIIAHRGAPKYVAENTIASLRKANELGATWVEFDVMLTKDGVPIILHDTKLDRTTDHKGYVRDKTFAELSCVDAGGGETIPTLENWLRVAAELGFGINVEIKESARRAQEISKKIYDLLQKWWPNTLPKPLISSAELKCIKAYRMLDATANTAYIVSFLPLNWRAKLQSIAACAIVIDYRRLTKSKIEKLHQAGYKVLAYTVNCAQQFKTLRHYGVDAVFTDDLKTVREQDAVPQNSAGS